MKFNKFERVFQNFHLEAAQESMGQLDAVWKELLTKDTQISDEHLSSLDSEKLAELVEEWENHVLHNKDAMSTYLNACGGLMRGVWNSMHVTQENYRDYEEALDITHYIQDSLLHVAPTRSLKRLILFHSRIRHLLMLVVLYAPDADRQTRTWRHLFEVGCRCMGIENEILYVQLFFPQEITNPIYDVPLGTEIKCFLTGAGKFITPSIIDRENDKARQRLMRIKLYNGLMYADLAYRNHTTSPQPDVRLHPYKINYSANGGKNIKGRFHLQGNMNGYVAYRGNRNPTLVLGFSGTEILSLKNWRTNFTQYLGHPDPVYIQAVGVLHGILTGKSHRRQFVNAPVEVYGHSLGGGLMQFAVGSNYDPLVRGYGYNSAGIDYSNTQWLYNFNCSEIWHLYRKLDYVFVIPETIQLGKSVKSEGIDSKFYSAHFISSIRKSAGKYHTGVAELGSK